jgi:hypothetical protein
MQIGAAFLDHFAQFVFAYAKRQPQETYYIEPKSPELEDVMGWYPLMGQWYPIMG